MNPIHQKQRKTKTLDNKIKYSGLILTRKVKNAITTIEAQWINQFWHSISERQLSPCCCASDRVSCCCDLESSSRWSTYLASCHPCRRPGHWLWPDPRPGCYCYVGNMLANERCVSSCHSAFLISKYWSSERNYQGHIKKMEVSLSPWIRRINTVKLSILLRAGAFVE